MDDIFLTSTNFQLKIEEIVEMKDISYIEAILEFCDDHDMEYDQVKKLLTTNLKDKIKVCAMNDGLMKKESVLPF